MAAEANGDFIVVWSGLLGIDGQRFASDGTPLGGEFQVNTYTADFDFYPSVAADADGDFVVVWTSSYLEPTYLGSRVASTVQGQLFASDGTTLGAQFQVNTYTANHWGFELPSVAAEADGDFVVVWPSGSKHPPRPGPDGDNASIQGQRFVPEPSSFLLRTAALVALTLLACTRHSYS